MSFRPGEVITIPSPIDVHAHLREPGGEDKETIASGTLAALRGGYQAVYDMPNNPAPHQTWSLEKLDEKIAIAEATAVTNIGFYAGVDLSDPDLDELGMMASETAGLKLYMGHTTGNTIRHGFETARPAIDEWMRAAKERRILPPILLHAREETGAETARYIGEHNYPVHWCHIASETEVRYARALTKDFPRVYTGGVTPHHLTMTSRNADFQQGWNGGRMQPPLGSEVDADMLLRAYNDSDIQILETDHAPHSREDKLRAETHNPSGNTNPDCVTCYGVSGIEFVLPVMMSLVQRRIITMNRLVDSLHDQPIKMLGLQKMAYLQGAQTDLIIGPYVIESDEIVGKSRNTPYMGWTGWARVGKVSLNGTVQLGGGEVTKTAQTRVLKNGSHI